MVLSSTILVLMRVQTTQPLQQLVLDQYANMLKDADAELLDQAKRYEKYAAAQAWLTDSSITLPTVSNGGAPMLQRTVPAQPCGFMGWYKRNRNILQIPWKCLKMLSQQKDFNKAKGRMVEEKAESQ